MEAGNRCYDNRVPEEINRRVIDQVSDVLMPYTHRSKENLIREGFAPERVYVIGNPIYEVLKTYRPAIEASDVLHRLNLQPRQYFAVTLHRAENVDVPDRLQGLIRGLCDLQQHFGLPVVASIHPRTADRARTFGIELSGIRALEPLGFFDFVALEQNARCVLTDSGTVQEECAILGIPNVTIRDVTERPETIECGSNVLAGGEPADILRAASVALESATSWTAPPEYLKDQVSATVLKIVLGYRHHHGGIPLEI